MSVDRLAYINTNSNKRKCFTYVARFYDLVREASGKIIKRFIRQFKENV